MNQVPSATGGPSRMLLLNSVTAVPRQLAPECVGRDTQAGYLPLHRGVARAMLVAMLLVAAGQPLCSKALAIDYHIVLKTGDQLPDTQEQAVAALVAPSINNSGRAAVVAGFLNPGLQLGQFTDATGPLIGAGVSGQPTPQLPGWVFDGSEVAALNDAGVVANFHLANNNRYLVTRGGATPLETVAFTGLAAPGLGTATFDRPGNYPGLNAAGAVAFLSTVAGVLPPNSQGIWTDAPGHLDLVAATGMAAPGAPGANFVAFSDPMIADLGQVAFLASLDLQLGSALPTIGVWTRTAGTVTPVMIPGDPLPLSVDFFDSARRFAIQASGEATFTSSLAGPQITAANDTGMWRQAGTGLQQVAREGDLAPGTGGAQFDDFFEIDSLSPAGVIAFGSHLRGTGVTAANDYALYTEVASTLNLVFREGDPAPGVPGAVFANWGTGFAVPKPEANDAGHIAFTGTITGPGVTNANNQGLWATTPAADRLVARTGQPIDVDPSPLVANIKIVSRLEFGNTIGTSGRLNRRVFNNHYEAGFLARFTDGSEAAIVADLLGGLPAIMVGDANLDAAVNLLDLEIMAGHFRQSGGAIFQEGDFNGDARVDVLDLNLLRHNWGQGADDFDATLATFGPLIPEPASLGLLAVGLLSMSARRRTDTPTTLSTSTKQRRMRRWWGR